MLEFDLLLYRIRNTIKENAYCEDNKLRLKNKVKYDIYNILCEVDKGFIEKLHKELEYKDDIQTIKRGH